MWLTSVAPTDFFSVKAKLLRQIPLEIVKIVIFNLNEKLYLQYGTIKVQRLICVVSF
jgi:hypothetical protein